MTTDEIQFYLRHHRQISEWAKLEKRVDHVLRDAVQEGSVDKAAKLFAGEFGDAEVDFYIRNRWLIAEWDALQTAAGKALHQALLTAAREAGCPAFEGKKGWTAARARSPELDTLNDDQMIWIEIAWTMQDLLSTRHGYPYPRIALVLHPNRWQSDTRERLINATRPVARELGMKKKLDWWVHWRILDEIAEHQDLPSYAADCVAKFQNAAERLYPVLRDAISAND